jgi:hypothetical protein
MRGVAMMDPVHTSFQPNDGGTDEQGLSTLVVLAVALAMFVIGGAFFYWVSTPSARVATKYTPIVDSFTALEASRSTLTPPSPSGQAGVQ